MRKLILILVTGLLSVSMFAQSTIKATPHNRAEMLAKYKNAPSYHIQPTAVDNGSGVPLDFTTFYAKTGLRTGTTIGETGYPLQTNSAAYDRVRAYGDGSVSAVYTGSTIITLNMWTDRGTFYNHYDGASWGPYPVTRVETIRTGFPELLTVEDHEVTVAHDGTAGAENLKMFANSTIGATDWTELGGSGMPTGLWNRSYCPDGTDDIYMIAASGGNPPTAITFSRSDDGGATWAVLNYSLPYLDSANCIGAVTADAYQIAVDGSTVYVLFGASFTNLVLLTSNSNGAAGSWTSQTIIETGLCNYQGDVGQTSDVDGDGIGDSIETTDGWHEMVLDNAGVLHIWSGYYILLDDDPIDATGGGWSYFPTANGLWYWNSTMAAGSPSYIPLLIDWDMDGDPFLGLGADLGMYDGVTLTSMPVAAIDESIGRIYLIYAMPIEYTDYFDNPLDEFAQSFRDLFGTYSDDGGLSWSSPVNMTYTANLQQESVFPSAYDRVIGGCVHTIWMQDQEPGTNLDTNNPDGDALNTVQYRCFDEERFNPYPPTAEYDYVPDGNLVTFTNLSIDADSYSWNFGDAGTSTLENPSHVYASSGTYNVCLTAFNVYDEHTACKLINIKVGVVDLALSQAISVYPSPASTTVNIQVDGNFGTLYAELYNALGEKVINTSSFNGNVQFDVTSLASGNYIVKVTSENGRYATRQITVSK